MNILFMILVTTLSGVGIKGASVHCDGFRVSQDDAVVDEAGLTDSRGAAWASHDGPIETTCHAWKDGYVTADFPISVDETHTRFHVALAKETK